MTSRTTLLLAAMLLSACGDDARPGSVAVRDASRSDLGFDDIPTNPADAGDDDVPLLPDGAVADRGAGIDSALPDGATQGDGGSADGTSPVDAAAIDRPVTPPTPFCGLTVAQMTQIAVKIATCTFDSPQRVMDRYFRPDTWEGGPVALRPCPSLTCVATARSCSAIMSDCLKYTVARASSGSCSTDVVTCGGAGRIAGSCRDGVNFFDDCEATGRRCVATSAVATCAPMMADPCADGAPARCVGTVLQNCVAGVYTSVRNCGLTASTCDATANACVGTGAACAGDATECDGTFLRACRGGRWQRLDCAQLVTGTSCQTSGGHAFCGNAAACDPTAGPAGGTCDGNTLVLCAGGATARYECNVNGFSGCGPTGCLP